MGNACPKAKGKEDIKCTVQADHRNGGRARLGEGEGGEGDLDNLGTTKVCLALHQKMELLGCYINFIKNQIFG